MLTDEEYLNVMDSIGIILPYEIPENQNISEDEARGIINKWFESSPDRKSMKNRQKSRIVETLSTKFVKAMTVRRSNMVRIEEGVLSTKKSSARISS